MTAKKTAAKHLEPVDVEADARALRELLASTRPIQQPPHALLTARLTELATEGERALRGKNIETSASARALRACVQGLRDAVAVLKT